MWYSLAFNSRRMTIGKDVKVQVDKALKFGSRSRALLLMLLAKNITKVKSHGRSAVVGHRLAAAKRGRFHFH